MAQTNNKTLTQPSGIPTSVPHGKAKATNITATRTQTVKLEPKGIPTSVPKGQAKATKVTITQSVKTETNTVNTTKPKSGGKKDTSDVTVTFPKKEPQASDGYVKPEKSESTYAKTFNNVMKNGGTMSQASAAANLAVDAENMAKAKGFTGVAASAFAATYTASKGNVNAAIERGQSALKQQNIAKTKTTVTKTVASLNETKSDAQDDNLTLSRGISQAYKVASTAKKDVEDKAFESAPLGSKATSAIQAGDSLKKDLSNSTYNINSTDYRNHKLYQEMAATQDVARNRSDSNIETSKLADKYSDLISGFTAAPYGTTTFNLKALEKAINELRDSVSEQSREITSLEGYEKLYDKLYNDKLTEFNDLKSINTQLTSGVSMTAVEYEEIAGDFNSAKYKSADSKVIYYDKMRQEVEDDLDAARTQRNMTKETLGVLEGIYNTVVTSEDVAAGMLSTFKADTLMVTAVV